MVSAFRLLTLCFLLVASMGLLLVSHVPAQAPINGLVIDCLTGDAEFPAWHVDRRSVLVRPALVDRPLRIDEISIIDGPADLQ